MARNHGTVVSDLSGNVPNTRDTRLQSLLEHHYNNSNHAEQMVELIADLSMRVTGPIPATDKSSDHPENPPVNSKLDEFAAINLRMSEALNTIHTYLYNLRESL